MPKFDYTNLRNTAIRLIAKFGRTVTKKAVTSSGTAWNPTQSKIDTPLIGAFVNFSKNEIDGTLIKATDKKLLTYDALILTDRILDDSIEYSIISVAVINPGDTKLIYIVQLRR